MAYILIDGVEWLDLCPLTLTRSIADLRIGIDTIYEKWHAALGSACTISTKAYLQPLYTQSVPESGIFINSSYLPSDEIITYLDDLQPGQLIVSWDHVIAGHLTYSEAVKVFNKEIPINDAHVRKVIEPKDCLHIANPWSIFLYNDIVLRSDFARITAGRTSARIDESNKIMGDNFFAEEGVEAYCSVFNTHTGPIYLGKETLVMEGTVVRGSLALCEHSVLKMGSKIYGSSTFGPHTKVGGEVNNSIFIGYTNKSHEGYLGNSVIGEWCNFGADTNSSNLKNNLKPVKTYSYRQKQMIDTHQQFLGLIMGDHSKTGINTMLNTGTVVGVSANIFGSGFPPSHIPSFSWVHDGEMVEFHLDKALATANAMMNRRQQQLSEAQTAVLKHIAYTRNEFL